MKKTKRECHKTYERPSASVRGKKKALSGSKKYKLVGEAYLHGLMDKKEFSHGLVSPPEKFHLV
jgi:hypothetical protein